MRKILKTILALILIGCLIYLGYWGYQYFLSLFSSARTKSTYSMSTTLSLYDASSSDSSLNDINPPDDSKALSDVQALKLLSSYKMLNIDHKRLSENTDYIGWIDIPDTKVSYPVYQSKDNNDYLHHDRNGSYIYAGEIFIDKNFISGSRNMVLHGHNMRIGTMFASIKRYTAYDYYNDHPFVIFYPKEGGVEIYRIYSTYQRSTSNIYDEAYQLIFNDSSYEAFINDNIKRSCLDCNYSPQIIDKTITLSTCITSNTRFVVHAGLFSKISN